MLSRTDSDGLSAKSEPDVDELDRCRSGRHPGGHEQTRLQRAERDGHVSGDRDARHDAGVRIDSAGQVDGHDDGPGGIHRGDEGGGLRPEPTCAADAQDPVDDEVGRLDQRPTVARLPATTAGGGRRPAAALAIPRRGRGPTGTGHRPGSRDRRAWPPPRAHRRRCCPSRRAGPPEPRPRRRGPPRARAHRTPTAPGRPAASGRPPARGGTPPAPQHAPGRRRARGSCDALRAGGDDEGDGHVTIMAERDQP